MNKTNNQEWGFFLATSVTCWLLKVLTVMHTSQNNALNRSIAYWWLTHPEKSKLDGKAKTLLLVKCVWPLSINISPDPAAGYSLSLPVILKTLLYQQTCHLSPPHCCLLSAPPDGHSLCAVYRSYPWPPCLANALLPRLPRSADSPPQSVIHSCPLPFYPLQLHGWYSVYTVTQPLSVILHYVCLPLSPSESSVPTPPSPSLALRSLSGRMTSTERGDAVSLSQTWRERREGERDTTTNEVSWFSRSP